MQTPAIRAAAQYEQMGRAALLPGMVHMLQLMENYVTEMRAQLQALQLETGVMAQPIQKRRGRPPKEYSDALQAATDRIHRELGGDSAPAKRKYTKKGYWDKMTPEQRKKEMHRRMKVSIRNGRPNASAMKAAASKPKTRLHPRDPKHPGHEKWIATMRKNAKARWAKIPKDKRTAAGLPSEKAAA